MSRAAFKNSAAALLLACLLLPPDAAGAAGAAGAVFLLTNSSDTAVSSVLAIPEDGQAAEQKKTVAPGATAGFAVDSRGWVRLEIRHASGAYIFPEIFFPRSKLAAVLTLEKDTAPLLRFPADPQCYPLRGENSSWGFAQILGSFPYGPGATTLARAESMGAREGNSPNSRKGTVVWQYHAWALTLTFDGPAPESVLSALRMETVSAGGGKLPMFIDEALEAHGYDFIRSVKRDGMTVDAYGPKDFVRRWKAAAEDRGRGGKGAAEARPGEIVVTFAMGKKNYVLSMVPAAEFVKGK